MNESLLGYMTLIFKLFLDRRKFRGSTEFSFRVMRLARDWYSVRVQSRDGPFRAHISLRRRTSDLATFEQVFANNDYNLRRLERWDDIRKFYQGIVGNERPLILDLGANIGLASLYFVKNWPEAHIVAVEPEARNYRLMCKNVAAFTNIVPMMAAVASEDGAVTITNPDATAWAMRTERAASGTAGTVPALSVPSLLATGPSELRVRPFIAKIDIEGFEEELFSKNTEWVNLFPVIIIELHDWLLPGRGTSNNFLRVISQHDRDFVMVGENVVSVANSLSRLDSRR